MNGRKNMIFVYLSNIFNSNFPRLTTVKSVYRYKYWLTLLSSQIPDLAEIQKARINLYYRSVMRTFQLTNFMIKVSNSRIIIQAPVAFKLVQQPVSQAVVLEIDKTCINGEIGSNWPVIAHCNFRITIITLLLHIAKRARQVKDAICPGGPSSIKVRMSNGPMWLIEFLLLIVIKFIHPYAWANAIRSGGIFRKEGQILIGRQRTAGRKLGFPGSHWKPYHLIWTSSAARISHESKSTASRFTWS